jgi:D-tyrosyl-tRNA(Tyr) deacylase
VRAVVQRVSQSDVKVEGQIVGQIGSGLLVLLGVAEGDTVDDAQYLASKVSGLRVFPDSSGKMNLSLLDTGGSALVISQFTLLGDVRRGKRPSFVTAANPEHADLLYQQFCQLLIDLGVPVQRGIFQADMQVSLINDGPVTILLDSQKLF